MIEVDLCDRQQTLSFDAARLVEAVRRVLSDRGVEAAEISLAVVDDPTIHDLNRRFLDHDEPTDVLSFLLEEGPPLEGEIVVSADRAERSAKAYGWAAESELLLYVIHGALHLVGFDDTTDNKRAEMRAAERKYLATFGLEPPAAGQPDAPPLENL